MKALATWHPSTILRVHAPERDAAYAQFVADLARVAPRRGDQAADRNR